MIINSKFPEFKNFLTENRMSTTHRETNVDNSGVSSTTQQSVSLDMESDSAAQDAYSEKKKKKGKKESEKESAKSANDTSVKTQEEFRTHTIKLLNLL